MNLNTLCLCDSVSKV